MPLADSRNAAKNLPGAATVRPFRAQDADAVVAIASASPEAAAWTHESYQRLPEQSESIALVAEAGPQIIGFLIARLVVDQAEILNLAVDARQRRQGCATALLTAALAECQSRGVHSLYLEVRQSNTPAIAFYAKHGFLKSGLRRGYYRNPDEPALTMMKILQSKKPTG